MLRLEPAWGQEHAGNAAALRNRCPKMPILAHESWAAPVFFLLQLWIVKKEKGSVPCGDRFAVFQKRHWKNWRGGSEGWKGQYQPSKCHFLSFLASVVNWGLFLFQCFLLYLYHLSYLNSTAQGRVQRRKIRLGMIRHYLTTSTVKQHWIRFSRKAGKSPSWQSAASKFLFPLDCTKLYFCYFFLVLSCKMGSFTGLPSSYQLSFWNIFRYF